MRGQHIDNEGMRRLAIVLTDSECKGLSHLDLTDNKIGAEGEGSLAGLLGKCNALAHLALMENLMKGFGTKGANCLAGVLGECKALAFLDLHTTSIFGAGGWMLAREFQSITVCELCYSSL
eukprot:1059169-Rhodomonas_salina.2